MFVDIRKLPDSVLPDELTLFDTAILEPKLWYGGSNNPYTGSFKQRILDGVESRKIRNAVVLENFAGYLPKMYGIKDTSTLGYFTDWLQNFNSDEDNVIYTVKPPYGKIEEGYRDLENRIEGKLVSRGFNQNATFLTAAAINYNIPTIVTTNPKLMGSGEYIKKMCDDEDLYLNSNFRVIGIKDYCLEKGLMKEQESPVDAQKKSEWIQRKPMGARPKSRGKIRQDGPGKRGRGRLSASFLG